MTEALKEPARLLAGQRALVTGANGGIGMAVAKALAAVGASVVVNYVSNEKVARQVVNDIKEGGGTAMAFQADVSKEGQVKVMFKEMIEAFGSIDILVNNVRLHRAPSKHRSINPPGKLPKPNTNCCNSSPTTASGRPPTSPEQRSGWPLTNRTTLPAPHYLSMAA